MTQQETGMTALQAIYARRAVRSYKGPPVDRETVRSLLAAAVQAPTAVHEEPWVFTVIQDREILQQLSDSAKGNFRKHMGEVPPEQRLRLQHRLDDPNFHIFYDAGTLVVIWGKPMGPFVTADCWLAAENLMLAACAKGLGTCVIGFAVGALNLPEWKARLGVPANWSAIAPIIVGVPAGPTPPVPRKEPEIASWR